MSDVSPTETADVPAPAPVEPDVEQIVNTGYNRYKPCALCGNIISVFDTTAGCQDPSLSHPECDRLPVVEAEQSTGTDSETPTGESTATPADTSTGMAQN